MKEKSDFSESENSLESFEMMEKNFSKVVHELVADRSLDKFREEYENLHDALVQSHEHNTVLMERCQELNNDILANTTKISSILSMSQTDQKTIAGLRHEFEKAWRMVEKSQEREGKTHQII